MSLLELKKQEQERKKNKTETETETTETKKEVLEKPEKEQETKPEPTKEPPPQELELPPLPDNKEDEPQATETETETATATATATEDTDEATTTASDFFSNLRNESSQRQRKKRDRAPNETITEDNKKDMSDYPRSMAVADAATLCFLMDYGISFVATILDPDDVSRDKYKLTPTEKKDIKEISIAYNLSRGKGLFSVGVVFWIVVLVTASGKLSTPLKKRTKKGKVKVSRSETQNGKTESKKEGEDYENAHVIYDGVRTQFQHDKNNYYVFDNSGKFIKVADRAEKIPDEILNVIHENRNDYKKFWRTDNKAIKEQLNRR